MHVINIKHMMSKVKPNAEFDAKNKNQHAECVS